MAHVKSRAAHLFRRDVDLGSSIQLNAEHQRALLTELAKFYPEFDWGEHPSDHHRYYLDNGLFTYGDAIILYSLLRYLKPKRVIEVGSGFSSALMLDTNDRFLNGGIQFTFIEPFSSRLDLFLGEKDREHCRVVRQEVQDIPLTVFQALETGDFLFIDSSHVSKIGSDVNFMVFEVLPALRPGIVVHFHDILWPFEYPEKWVVKLRWSWNEAYLIRAFLQYNSRFEILMFNSFVGYRYSDFIEQHMPLFMKYTGASLWLRKA